MAEAQWDRELKNMFREFDKDNSGELTRQDLIFMLLEADKKEKKDPTFKMNVKFLINVLKTADLNDDTKISYDEFKTYMAKCVEQSKGK